MNGREQTRELHLSEVPPYACVFFNLDFDDEALESLRSYV